MYLGGREDGDPGQAVDAFRQRELGWCVWASSDAG